MLSILVDRLSLGLDDAPGITFIATDIESAMEKAKQADVLDNRAEGFWKQVPTASENAYFWICLELNRKYGLWTAVGLDA